MKPIITVIVPYYKTPKLRFRKCIESLIEQTFQEFEVLLIDDGNEDEYMEIEKEYSLKDERVHFVHKKHEGVSAARNYGISMAKGQYLSFIDADDYVDISFLQKMYTALKDSDLAVCGVDEQYFPVLEGWNDKRIFWSQPNFFNGLQYINFSVNKLYKTDIIRKHNISFPTEIKLGEDALFLNQYFEYCGSIRCIGDLLYHYVPNEQSAIHQFKPSYWEWERQVIAMQWKRFHTYSLSAVNEMGMTKWLFIKLKGAFFYYISHMNDSEQLDRQLGKMMEDDSFLNLMNGVTGKENPHLSRNERIILRLWRIFGVKGIKMTYKISVIKGGRL